MIQSTDPISAAHFLASEDTRNISAGPCAQRSLHPGLFHGWMCWYWCCGRCFWLWLIFVWKLPNLQRSKQTNTCYHMLNLCLLKSFTLVSFNSWATLDSYHEQWTCSKKQKGNYNTEIVLEIVYRAGILKFRCAVNLLFQERQRGIIQIYCIGSGMTPLLLICWSMPHFWGVILFTHGFL